MLLAGAMILSNLLQDFPRGVSLSVIWGVQSSNGEIKLSIVSLLLTKLRLVFKIGKVFSFLLVHALSS